MANETGYGDFAGPYGSNNTFPGQRSPIIAPFRAWDGKIYTRLTDVPPQPSNAGMIREPSLEDYAGYANPQGQLDIALARRKRFSDTARLASAGDKESIYTFWYTWYMQRGRSEADARDLAQQQADIAINQAAKAGQNPTQQTPAPRVGLMASGGTANNRFNMSREQWAEHQRLGGTGDFDTWNPSGTVLPKPEQNAGGLTVDALREEIRKLLAVGNRDGAIKTAQSWFRLYSTTGEDPMAQAMAFVNSVGQTASTRAAISSGGQADTYRPLGQRTAEEARRQEFEGSEEGRHGLFQDVLRKMVGNYDYDSPALRRGYESRIPGLQATYELDPALRGEAGEGEAPSWQDFLRSGRSAMSPNEIQAGISRIGGLGGPLEQQSLHDRALVNQFRSGGKSDEAAFSAMVAPYLQNVSPMMREAYGRALSQQFQRMRLEQPDKSFAQQLKEMGGRLF